MHDFTLDENTGYAGVPPVTAIRYTGDYRAGSPVAQSAYNTVYVELNADFSVERYPLFIQHVSL